VPSPVAPQRLPPRVDGFDHMLASRHLLVGGAQPQFLLVLDALAKVQNGFERENGMP